MSKGEATVVPVAHDEAIEHLNLGPKLQHLRALLKEHNDLGQHVFGIVDHFVTRLPTEETNYAIGEVETILFDKLKQYDEFELKKATKQLQDDVSTGWELTVSFSGSGGDLKISGEYTCVFKESTSEATAKKFWANTLNLRLDLDANSGYKVYLKDVQVDHSWRVDVPGFSYRITRRTTAPVDDE